MSTFIDTYSFKMGFFDFFRDKKNKKSENNSSLFFHEDDFCQIELIPIENYDDAKSQLEKSSDFSREHFDGVGYTDIYLRSENKFELERRKILVRDLHNLLINVGFTEVGKVTTGYGQDYRVVPENTVGFGHDYSAIYYDYKSDFVTNIWLTQPFNIEKKKLIHFLTEVGKRWYLLLVDWEASEVVHLSEEKAISKYLSSE